MLPIKDGLWVKTLGFKRWEEKPVNYTENCVSLEDSYGFLTLRQYNLWEKKILKVIPEGICLDTTSFYMDRDRNQHWSRDKCDSHCSAKT